MKMFIIRKRGSAMFGVPTFGNNFQDMTLREQPTSGIVWALEGDAQSVLDRSTNGKTFEVVPVQLVPH